MKTYKFNYNSIAELAAAATADGERRRDNSSQHDGGANSFYGGLTFDEAGDIARAGGYWPEGAAKMEAASATIDGGNNRTRRAYTSAYVGARVNVARAVAGAPRCMTKMITKPSHKRIIKMAVHVGRQANCDQYESVNRGAAILSVIREIEAAGDQVELWACWHNESEESNTRVQVSTLIKPAAAFFSPADCAFALCHVAFQRRLNWSIAELNKGADNITGGYGSGVPAKFTDFDCHIPYMLPDQLWDTPEGALRKVKSELNKQNIKTAAA